MVELWPSIETMPTSKLWALLKEGSAPAPQLLTVDELGERSIAELRQDSLADTIKQRLLARRQIEQMNITWLNKMVNSAAQLREKMSFFWHGHFATRQLNSPFQRDLLHIIRTNALGNFGALLSEVSKSPAMLQFLNNQQNRKQSPNENFARELMELFTLGRGHYTEQDIKESARAFTGWGFNKDGNFAERSFFHDTGSKTFLGQTGEFTGSDIIRIILSQKQTATFICTKLYKFLVNDKADNARIEQLADLFFKSGYEIMPVLESIFTSDWFYEPQDFGSRIKSPIELIVGMRRMLPMSLAQPQLLLRAQKILGQILFLPPNVSGWPSGRAWIDSSTLLFRLQLPKMLAIDEKISVQPKQDDDLNMGIADEVEGNRFSVDWPSLEKNWGSFSGIELQQRICTAFLLSDKKFAMDFAGPGNIKSVVLSVMRTPEYQVC